jgi:hypothetical protein
MMVALLLLLVLSAVAQVAGPRPSVLASAWALMASPAQTVEWLPSVRVAAWLSAARAVEAPPSVLLAAWAPKPAVLLPMVPRLCPRRARFSPMRGRVAEQPIAPSR